MWELVCGPTPILLLHMNLAPGFPFSFVINLSFTSVLNNLSTFLPHQFPTYVDLDGMNSSHGDIATTWAGWQYNNFSTNTEKYSFCLYTFIYNKSILDFSPHNLRSYCLEVLSIYVHLDGMNSSHGDIARKWAGWYYNNFSTNTEIDSSCHYTFLYNKSILDFSPPNLRSCCPEVWIWYVHLFGLFQHLLEIAYHERLIQW